MVTAPRVQRLSFSATGTPASGPGIAARCHRGVDRVGPARASSGEHG